MQLPPFPESPPQPALPDDASSGPETPLIIARGSREALGNLVLLLAALGIAYTWRMHSGQLLVAARDAERVLEEWRRYADENAAWPEPPAPMLEQTALPPTLLCMAALAIFFACTGPWTEGNSWFATGAVDSQAIVQGQWWRLVTALTLHADFNHLLGNVLIGGLMLHLLCRRMGYGLGWFLTLAAAVLANWCNVVLRQGPHLSVGFSTAVFAAIGLLCGSSVYRGRWRLFRALAPLGAGVGLLVMLGMEGERTDLGAHLFGFACGATLGLACRLGPLSGHLRRELSQFLVFALACTVVLASWHAAWR